MEATFIYPNQLFDPHPAVARKRKIFLIEDPLFFGDTEYSLNFNKKKILLHYLSMSYYAKRLNSAGYICEVIPYNELLHHGYTSTIILNKNITNIHMAEIIDYELNRRINKAVKKIGAKIIRYNNPNFLLNNDDIKIDFKDKKFHFMANFYKKQRKRFNILLTSDEKPIGGKWSFDEHNRKKIPRNIVLPAEDEYVFDKQLFNNSVHKTEINFPNNLGDLVGFNYPCNHEMGKKSFETFLENKLELFGPYEDAIPRIKSSLFHSVLTPYLNLGLISPKEVLDMVLEKSKESKIPINSVEGFIRQIIGWREFIRGVYQECGTNQRTKNYWKFTNKIPNSFYKGRTGLDPVDFVIKKSCDNAYAHHIERLMIIGNILFLLEINPDDVYKWFMEHYIDAYDWVMVPNVYGMSQFADGGLMSTKPYISGSNYILKMSDYKKGDWSNVWDALYWEFINDKRSFFLKNPRMAMMVKIYDKKPNDMKSGYSSIKNSFYIKLNE